MKNLMCFLLLIGTVGLVTAQTDGTGGNERERRVVVVDYSGYRGNAVASDDTRTSLESDVLVVQENEAAARVFTYEVIDEDGTPVYDFATSNRRATPAVMVNNKRVLRDNRTEVGGESLDDNTEIIDLTTLAPGDYTVRVRNKKGKVKAEKKIKVKGKKQAKKKGKN